MITNIRTEKLLVISDLHLGNPFSQTKNQTLEFLYWARANNYDLCINGDGFEVAQVSFAKLACDVPDVLRALKAYTNSGLNVYYVVGNHDIVFENFLNDWGGFMVAPFLNCWNKDIRIRIEHGHLYDPLFVKHPDYYEFITWFAGFALKIHPQLYNLWMAVEVFQSRFGEKNQKGIVGEHENFINAAEELLARGFDHIVFGHTHHAGVVDMKEGKYYLNSGSWLTGTSYVHIENGKCELKEWIRSDLANAS